MYIDCAVYPTIFTINIKHIFRHERLLCVYSLRNFGTHFDQCLYQVIRRMFGLLLTCNNSRAVKRKICRLACSKQSHMPHAPDQVKTYTLMCVVYQTLICTLMCVVYQILICTLMCVVYQTLICTLMCVVYQTLMYFNVRSLPNFDMYFNVRSLPNFNMYFNVRSLQNFDIYVV